MKHPKLNALQRSEAFGDLCFHSPWRRAFTHVFTQCRSQRRSRIQLVTFIPRTLQVSLSAPGLLLDHHCALLPSSLLTVLQPQDSLLSCSRILNFLPPGPSHVQLVPSAWTLFTLLIAGGSPLVIQSHLSKGLP